MATGVFPASLENLISRFFAGINRKQSLSALFQHSELAIVLTVYSFFPVEEFSRGKHMGEDSRLMRWLGLRRSVAATVKDLSLSPGIPVVEGKG